MKSTIRHRAFQIMGVIVLTCSFSVWVGQSTVVFAQDQESDEFFEEGDEQIEQDIDSLEDTQPRESDSLLIEDEPSAEEDAALEGQEATTICTEEQDGQEEVVLEGDPSQCEQQLGEPEVEFVPSADEELGLDENVPGQPTEEVQIEF